MTYLVAIVIGALFPWLMRLSPFRGKTRFSIILVIFGFIGTIPLVLWYIHEYQNFIEFIQTYPELRGDVYQDIFKKVFAFPAIVAGSYFTLVFIGLWKSSESFGAPLRWFARYFSLTWATTAIACFYFSFIPFIVGLVSLTITKKFLKARER